MLANKKNRKRRLEVKKKSKWKIGKQNEKNNK